MTDWQPIATAPQDRPLLLWYPFDTEYYGGVTGVMFIGQWRWGSDKCPDDDYPTWRDPENLEILGETCTHWMALPKPPMV